MVHSSTDSFKGITIAKRGCRFLDEIIEGDESIFNHYTQKGCLFECSMRSVTNCTPWDYPLPTNVDPANMPPLCTTHVIDGKDVESQGGHLIAYFGLKTGPRSCPQVIAEVNLKRNDN